MKKVFYGFDLDLGDEPFAGDMPSGADVAAVRIAANALAAGGTLVDVGAHVGTISVPVAAVSPKARVVAFEPLPENFALLRENAGKHSPANFVAERLAVGAACGTGPFAPSDSNSQDGRLAAKTPCGLVRAFGEEKRREIPVAVVSLEAYFRDVPPERPVVLKVDVQGAECAVLRGARGLPVDILLVEVWPYGLLRAGENCASLVQELSRWPFGALLSHWTAQPFRGGHLGFVQALPWDAAAKGAYTDYIDLACCDPARAEGVRAGDAR